MKDAGERHEHLDDRDDEEVPITWIGNKTTPSHEPKGEKGSQLKRGAGPAPAGSQKGHGPAIASPLLKHLYA